MELECAGKWPINYLIVCKLQIVLKLCLSKENTDYILLNV